MSNETLTNSSGGIGFVGLLTILFVGLKLTGYISWSWWWVLPPILLSLGMVLGLLFIILVIFVISVMVKK